MADKRRYTVTLPDHVADAVESRSKPLGATPTEYAADVLRWWFGQGCPPVTHDETALLANTLAKRLKPVPENLDVWSLNPKDEYVITDDNIVQKILGQLGLPNLFAAAVEHDELRMTVVFDNHQTHWLQFDFFKGGATPDMNGLAFTARPKASVTRAEMAKRMRDDAKKMESSEPATFSQIPMLEKKAASNQATTKTSSSR